MTEAMTPPPVPKWKEPPPGNGAPCHLCGKPCDAWTGNAALWPIALCHADEPGVSKWHHSRCVSAKLALVDHERRRADEAEKKLKFAETEMLSMVYVDENDEPVTATAEAVVVGLRAMYDGQDREKKERGSIGSQHRDKFESLVGYLDELLSEAAPAPKRDTQRTAGAVEVCELCAKKICNSEPARLNCPGQGSFPCPIEAITRPTPT